jgi:hypothetical protein
MVLTCSFCGYSTSKRFNMNRHTKTMHGLALLECEPTEPKVAKDEPKVAKDEPKVAQDEPKVAKDEPKVADTMTSGTRHVCNECNNVFATSSSLKRHREICKKVVNSLTCPICLEMFHNKHQKYHHMKKCKARELTVTTLHPSAHSVAAAPQPTHINTTEQNAEVINNTTNTNIHTNIDSINNIVINNFGSEDKSHITRDMMHQWLLQTNGIGLFNYFKHLNFNMDVPQNHNILDHPNRKMLSVLTDGEWIAADAEVTMDAMLKKCRADLISCSSDPEFRRIVTEQEDVLMILQNHLKFSSESTPNQYYRIMRMFNAELINFMHRKAGLS